MGLLDYLSDSEERAKLTRGLLDAINRGGVGGLLGAPVDIANMALRPIGLGSDNPVMGSEWIGNQMQQAGMVSGQRNPLAEGLAGFVDPGTLAPVAMKAAAYGAPLLAALGATAIGSKASEGAKFSELANVLHGQRGATAWHGSPHLFDKFKSEAIGTGEGAQAYGHGLYLAESPKVAQSYKENLSKNKVAINGQPINNAAPDELAAAVLVQSKGNKNAALQFLQSNLQYAKGDSVKKLNNAINYLKSGQELPVAEIAGSLYKTDIPNAHIDKMLDWDKPLSEQHPDVRAALSGLNLPDKPWNTGSKIYESLSGKTGFKNAQEQQQYATAKLQELGIPGIKYLDGSSRTAGEGTRNFVIFDPEHIRILERNGQPTGQQPWDLGQ